MNDKRLDPEVRMKVAEEITGRPAKADGPHIISGNRHWQPHFVCEQKSALTRTAARLIRDTPSDEGDRSDTWRLFGESVADDDVNALERIVAELKGFL